MDWKIIYIGSPTNSQYDQVIDSFDMDNLKPGVMNFQIESNPPDFNLIPQEEIVGKIHPYFQEQQPFSSPSHMKNSNSLELDTM